MMDAPTPSPRRTDADVFAEARQSLDRRASIPATVRVHIEDGVARLTGIVRQVSERAEAEAVLRSVAGVHRVLNEISVAQTASAQGFERPED